MSFTMKFNVTRDKEVLQFQSVVHKKKKNMQKSQVES